MPPEADHSREGAVDIVVGGSPRGDGDAHGGAALPDGAAAPARTVGLERGDNRAREFVGAKADEDLVDHDVVQNVGSGSAEFVGEAAGVRAGAVDHFGDAEAAERAKGGPDFHSASAARHLGSPLHGLALGGLLQVSRLEVHRAEERFRMADEGEAAIVGDVQPLMPIGAPGVAGGEAVHEVSGIGGRGGPETEGAIDVEPELLAGWMFDESVRGIESAGVHVAGLETNDGGSRDGWQEIGTEASVRIRRDASDAVAAEAEEGEGFSNGDVALVAHDDGKGRSAEETVGLGVPALGGEEMLARGGEAGEIGHGGAGDQGSNGTSGEAEEIARPFEGEILEEGGDGRHGAERDVLIPGGGEDVGGAGGGQRSAVDEAEVAAARVGDGGRGTVAVEVGENGGWIGGSGGEGAGEVGETGDVLGGRTHAARAHGFEISCAALRGVEDEP